MHYSYANDYSNYGVSENSSSNIPSVPTTNSADRNLSYLSLMGSYDKTISPGAAYLPLSQEFISKSNVLSNPNYTKQLQSWFEICLLTFYFNLGVVTKIQIWKLHNGNRQMRIRIMTIL